MLIASKYEEIYSPEIDDFIYITDYSYDRAQILAMETSLLQQIEFDLTFPTAFRFLQRFAELAEVDHETFIFGCYLCELSFIDVKMNKWTPSRIASSAIFLAKKILKKQQPWC